jgi:hypothetical protein
MVCLQYDSHLVRINTDFHVIVQESQHRSQREGRNEHGRISELQDHLHIVTEESLQQQTEKLLIGKRHHRNEEGASDDER